MQFACKYSNFLKNTKYSKKIESIYYIDYYTPMKVEDGSLKSSYTFDGLHPNEEGYKIMEALVQNAIKDVLND